MKKEEQARLVHDLGFRKRQRHAHKTGQTLPQGVIPPLDVGSFSGLFSYLLAHSGNITMRTFCQALFETDL